MSEPDPIYYANLAQRNKIEAIKQLREATGMSLKEAKEQIEAWSGKGETAVADDTPDFHKNAKGGCGGLILVGLLPLVGIFLLVI